MKLLLVSDTHRLTNYLGEELLPQYANEIECVIHLGDYPSDLIQYKGKFPNLNMVAIDGIGGDRPYPLEQILTYKVSDNVECKLLALHGHNHNVKTNLDRLVYYAQEKQVQACFFGHTHAATIFEKNGILFINPGSLSMPRDGRRNSHAIVTISPEGKIIGELISK